METVQASGDITVKIIGEFMNMAPMPGESLGSESVCSGGRSTIDAAAKRCGSERVHGLDSLRLWCALWVYFSHFGFLPLPAVLETGALGAKLIRGFYNNLFCGVAAVMVFFVISGFCIHFPYRNIEKISLAEFYIRRYVRILVPLSVSLGLARVAKYELGGFYAAILWSLVAEIIYYSLYPVIRIVIRRFGWRIALTGSFLGAVGVIAYRPLTLDYHDFGPYLTWAVGLPCWLLGCYLAEKEHMRAASIPTKQEIWRWRLIFWAGSIVASMLRFHASVGYPYSLTVLGIFAYAWLRQEIRYYRETQPNSLFEAMGAFSYSIYLTHGLGVQMVRLGIHPLSSAATFWAVQTICMLLISYLFYLAVERPAHKLARTLARSIRPREAVLAEAPAI